ncbi:hypothetical protein FIBSPDRAFT_882069 [Athelia psychrophila]|uniref:Ubiquitin-like protease family profile domain-containing protein n=1 Tax=Athelia psychrophila TaxID=1759441 RepID=A0A166W330_9AGAM|nr:hypothetical protein FIBSPDRAFT_882069 [Fibularhizoctonia sp. CBS 109695]
MYTRCIVKLYHLDQPEALPSLLEPSITRSTQSIPSEKSPLKFRPGTNGTFSDLVFYNRYLVDTPFGDYTNIETVVTRLFQLYVEICVSVNKFDILSEDIMQHIMFATTAMHAYAHQWSCQLMYNPRLKPGVTAMGTWTSGHEHMMGRSPEGSRAREGALGPVGVGGEPRGGDPTVWRGGQRGVDVGWILDRQLTFIGYNMRSGLGDWIRRKLKSGVIDMTKESEKTLLTCGATEAELREQWGLQEVDAVFTLQDNVAAVERVIDNTRTALSQGKGGAAHGTKTSLQELRDHHQQLLAGVEKLYASLNVHEDFPELAGVDSDFVRILLLARDSKINIRKRAVGSFLEWERLDQAVGGKNQALGTKAHQRTRQAITRRKPALMRAIHTFNKYCGQLADLHDLSSNLMEDIWISRREEEMPRWLADSNMRNGIRAVLKKDGCLRERCRLGREADSLCRWLGHKLSAVELAIRNPTHHLLHPLLFEQHRQLLFLEKRWSTPLASSARFQSAVQEAEKTAKAVIGEDPFIELNWMPTVLPPTTITVEEGTDGAIDMLPVPDFSVSESQILDSDNLITEDELEGSDDRSDESLVENVSAVVSSTLPDNICIDLISHHGVTAEELVPVLSLSDFRNRQLIPVPHRGCFHFVIEGDTFKQFLSPTAQLNDNSLNGAAILLQTQLLKGDMDTAASVAVLSTHDLDTWVLPIHRRDIGHWVLCIIYPNKQCLRLFDSFAEQRPWHVDLKNIMTLVARLCCIARKNGCVCLQYDFEGWDARPLIARAVQTNGYDCGIWVLAVIHSVLMGYDHTSCGEPDMKRALLYSLWKFATSYLASYTRKDSPVIFPMEVCYIVPGQLYKCPKPLASTSVGKRALLYSLWKFANGEA